MSCPYYNFKSGLFSADYWCDKKDCSVNDDIYYKYCRNYSYDSCPIYKQSQSSGCFITTVVCKILGEKDDSLLLNNFRNFRDNVLKSDSKYYDILKDYDTIGPSISDCIINDKDRLEMARGLYDNALLPISDLINKKEYDKACNNYYIMTLMLINYYGLKHSYNNREDYQINDINTLGHGYRRVKTTN